MITKAQQKTLLGDFHYSAEPKLSTIEKEMLKWAIVDPKDKVLDSNVGNGLFGEYLRRNMMCEFCGMSENIDDVRIARSRLQNCDIIYASSDEIPWKANAFDVVFAKFDSFDSEKIKKDVDELKRVLRDGGQLVVGLISYPGIVGSIMENTREEWNGRGSSHKKVISALSSAGLEEAVWTRTGLLGGVITAWKHKDGIPV